MSELQVSPSSKTVDVNEGGSYSIQFIEDDSTDIRTCYYISATISGSFEVVKSSNETGSTYYLENYSDTNTITEYGKSGSCRIEVKSVDANGPKLWTLVGHDVKNDVNVTAEFVVNFYCKCDAVY